MRGNTINGQGVIELRKVKIKRSSLHLRGNMGEEAERERKHKGIGEKPYSGK